MKWRSFLRLAIVLGLLVQALPAVADPCDTAVMPETVDHSAHEHAHHAKETNEETQSDHAACACPDDCAHDCLDANVSTPSAIAPARSLIQAPANRGIAPSALAALGPSPALPLPLRPPIVS